MYVCSRILFSVRSSFPKASAKVAHLGYTAKYFPCFFLVSIVFFQNSSVYGFKVIQKTNIIPSPCVPPSALSPSFALFPSKPSYPFLTLHIHLFFTLHSSGTLFAPFFRHPIHDDKVHPSEWCTPCTVVQRI